MPLKNVIRKLSTALLSDRALQIIKKAYYARVLRSISEIDELDFKVIKYLVNPGDSVIDIGANIGVYTKLLSDQVGIQGRVYSIEPIPSTFEILSSNVRKLELKNVELINNAISDVNGIVEMVIPLYLSGGENFYQARILKENNSSSLRQITVEAKTIDTLFSVLGKRISLIKCDTEGHELECIKGAFAVIKKSMPVWLIEISKDPDQVMSTGYETFRILNEEGYEAYWFDGEHLNRRCLGDKSINYLFLSPKHLRTLEDNGFFSLFSMR